MQVFSGVGAPPHRTRPWCGCVLLVVGGLEQLTDGAVCQGAVCGYCWSFGVCCRQSVACRRGRLFCGAQGAVHTMCCLLHPQRTRRPTACMERWPRAGLCRKKVLLCCLRGRQHTLAAAAFECSWRFVRAAVQRALAVAQLHLPPGRCRFVQTRRWDGRKRMRSSCCVVVRGRRVSRAGFDRDAQTPVTGVHLIAKEALHAHSGCCKGFGARWHCLAALRAVANCLSPRALTAFVLSAERCVIDCVVCTSGRGSPRAGQPGARLR